MTYLSPRYRNALAKLGVDPGLVPDLTVIAHRWVESYRDAVHSASPALVKAFFAQFIPGSPATDVAASKLHEFEGRLLRLQAEAEGRLLDLTNPNERRWQMPVTEPTLFIFE